MKDRWKVDVECVGRKLEEVGGWRGCCVLDSDGSNILLPLIIPSIIVIDNPSEP